MGSNKPICFIISTEAEEKLEHLVHGDKCTALWRAENMAIATFKPHKYNWEQYLYTDGHWDFPTINQTIRFHWRFEGVEDNKPVFYINHITSEQREAINPVSPDYSIIALFFNDVFKSPIFTLTFITMLIVSLTLLVRVF